MHGLNGKLYVNGEHPWQSHYINGRYVIIQEITQQPQILPTTIKDETPVPKTYPGIQTPESMNIRQKYENEFRLNEQLRTRYKEIYGDWPKVANPTTTPYSDLIELSDINLVMTQNSTLQYMLSQGIEHL